MALILDKTITGITLVDESGNTMETGYTNLYLKDDFGIEHNDPYLVLDSVKLNKNSKNALIYVSIFNSKLSRFYNYKPIYHDVIQIFDINIYDEYYNIEIMETNSNLFKQSYILVNELYFKNWISDEDEIEE